MTGAAADTNMTMIAAAAVIIVGSNTALSFTTVAAASPDAGSV